MGRMDGGQTNEMENEFGARTLVRGTGSGYAPPRTSRLAIASLVLGILGIFFSILTAIPGLVLGIVAICQIQRSRRHLTGVGTAIAGIIISILATINLIPLLLSARVKADQAICASNLERIGVATSMYTQDYDEHFPPAAIWGDELYPYIKDRAVFKCPADDSGSGSSYAFNSALGGLSLNALEEPASTVGTFDARSQWNQAGSADLLAFRRNGGAFIALADGHVKWIRPNEITLFGWNPRLSRASESRSRPRPKTRAKNGPRGASPKTEHSITGGIAR